LCCFIWEYIHAALLNVVSESINILPNSLANKLSPLTVAYSLRQLHQYQKLIHSLHRAYLLDNTFLNHSKTGAPINQYKKDANPRLAPKFCVTGFVFEVVFYQGVNS